MTKKAFFRPLLCLVFSTTLLNSCGSFDGRISNGVNTRQNSGSGQGTDQNRGGYVPRDPSPTQPQNPGTPTYPPQTNPPSNINLATDQIFTQGDSNWCWAYSAFHTLRSYYANSSDPSVTPWKNTLAQLNSPQAFRAYMGKESNPSEGGDPIELVEMLEKSYHLPDEKWQDFYARNSSAQTLFQRVDANLRSGIPSTWCNYNHCVAVLGVNGVGNAAQYTIGDSGGGDTTYQMSAYELTSQMDMVMLRL